MRYIAVFHGLTRLFATTGYNENTLFIVASVPFALLVFGFSLTHRYAAVFWSVAGCILVQLAFLDGVDISHHAFRVIGLVNALHARDVSGLLVNPLTGQAFPVFVYFSFVPYLPALGLQLVGVPAYIAMKLTLAALLLLFCGGLQRLVVTNTRAQGRPGDAGFQLLILALFLCSSCIYGLWTLTDELGEIAIYALVPWIVMALSAPRSGFTLAALFFIQLIVHPAMFGHAVLGEVALAYAMTRSAAWAILHRMLVPALGALALATPFWLPQILWIHHIVGNAVIPLRFYDTFMDITELCSRHVDWATGPWLLLAVGLTIIAGRGRLDRRGWWLIAALVLILAMQTIYLRDIVVRIPGISIFQFIFRFMIPAAFIALAVLLGFLSPQHRATRVALAVLLVLAFADMFLLRIVRAPQNAVPYVYDATGYAHYLVADNALGVSMLRPNLAGLPVDCRAAGPGGRPEISFARLVHGMVPGAARVAVADGPVGIVGYRVDGQPVGQARCGSDLILGPLPAGGTFVVDERQLGNLFLLRLASMLAAGLLFVGIPLATRRRIVRAG